jgi:DNA end-binding protein Ku
MAKQAAKQSTVESTSAAINEILNPTAAPATTSNSKTLATRSTWKGTLHFGAVHFAVGTYKATDEEKISFNMVCPDCRDTQLNQGAMHCSKCNEDVEKSEAIYGYKNGEGFVFVSDDERAACEPASDKVLEIVRFVKATEIDPIYFAKTEFVGPQGENKKSKVLAASGYAMLRAAMVNKDVVAIARRSTRGKEQYVVVRPFGNNMLVASDLLFANEVRGFEKTADLAAAPEAAVKLAENLIDNMTETFNENAQSDSYMTNMRALLDSKIAKQEAPVFAKREEVADTDDLMAALQASLTKAA